MKKENSVVNEKAVYNISILSKNIAIVTSITGKSCLVNMKTHEFIGNFDNYSLYAPITVNEIYFQEKSDKSYVNIYDTKIEKYIVENYLYIGGNRDYAILQNPKTQKFHLFDVETIRNETNIFAEEFDSINTILNECYGTYTVVEQNGKKGVYKEGIGMTTPIEYDEIKRINNQEVILFEKEGKSYFTFYHARDGMIESPLFDSIECDSKCSDILYCKINNHIAIYDTNESHRKLLCKFPMVDEIRCLEQRKKARNIFLVKRNGKYGLYGFYDDDRRYDDIECPVYIKIVEAIYDKIEKEYDNYFLYKDGKVGLYTKYSKGYETIDCIVEPIYDEIRDFDKTYLLFTDNQCNIVTLDNIETPYVTNCEFVENYYDDVIFKKNGKYGIYIPTSQKKYVIENMDNIICKAYFDKQYLYLTQKNGKQGILYDAQELIEPIYESIFIYGVNESEFHRADFYYFKLKDEKIKLAKIFKKDYRSDYEFVIQDGEYENIEFYENIMLLDNGQTVELYNYNEKLLKILASGTKIQTINLNGKNVYKIDGTYYFYREGKFEIAFIEDYELYVTQYETDTSSFKASTFNKEEHDKFCLAIDSQSDEDAEKSLLEMANNPYSMKSQYPTLVLKKINK